MGVSLYDGMGIGWGFFFNVFFDVGILLFFPLILACVSLIFFFFLHFFYIYLCIV